jgi:hypothetical protein
MPSAQSTSKITAIVQSIVKLAFQPDSPAENRIEHTTKSENAV